MNAITRGRTIAAAGLLAASTLLGTALAVAPAMQNQGHAAMTHEGTPAMQGEGTLAMTHDGKPAMQQDGTLAAVRKFRRTPRSVGCSPARAVG